MDVALGDPLFGPGVAGGGVPGVVVVEPFGVAVLQVGEPAGGDVLVEDGVGALAGDVARGARTGSVGLCARLTGEG